MTRWRAAIGGLTVAGLVACGLTVGAAPPPAGASVCNALGITGGDVGSTGSSGSSDLGFGSADFGSYRAGGKKPQQPLPKLRGVTRAVAWVTGPRSPNHTDTRFAITSTDVGVPWDNGSGQVLMAFGDTWGKCAGQMVWRHNTMLRADGNSDLDKGVTIHNAIPGSVRSGASVTGAHPTFAQPIVNAIGVRNIEVGRIPTAGISVNGTQYLSYMSINKWGAPGRWVTNFSAIAVSHNNGQTWTTDTNTVRANLGVTIPGVRQVNAGHGRFQMSAFLKAGGYVYQYGTPNGRRGAAFVARSRPSDILALDRYEYFTGRGWSPDAAAAVAVVRQPVSEMSVAYNDYLKRYVMLTERSGSLMLRTAPTPTGPFGPERTLVSRSETSGLYAPYVYPRGGGRNLYFVASRWDDYNVMLLKADLSKLR